MPVLVEDRRLEAGLRVADHILIYQQPTVSLLRRDRHRQEVARLGLVDIGIVSQPTGADAPGKWGGADVFD